MPHKKYFRTVLIIGFTFFAVAIGIYSSKLLEHAGIPILESRNYYSSGSANHKLETNFYDNLRTENDDTPVASIQSDVIEEPFLKLFINYTKILDENLAKIYKEPTLSDNLRNSQKRPLRDAARLECLGTYFQISINDSTLNSPEFLFETNARGKGIKAYLNTENCKIGRNTLHIKTLKTDSLPKKVYDEYVAIPFWYSNKGK